MNRRTRSCPGTYSPEPASITHRQRGNASGNSQDARILAYPIPIEAGAYRLAQRRSVNARFGWFDNSAYWTNVTSPNRHSLVKKGSSGL